MRNKEQAIQALKRIGLRTPPSFSLTASELNTVQRKLDEYSNVKYWYLRSGQKTDKDILTKVALNKNLAAILKEAFLLDPDAVIIAQERIDVSYGGVFAKARSFTFVEYVKGGLKSLLRDGVTPSRIILDKRGNVLSQHVNEQEFWYLWEGERLITKEQVTPSPLTAKILSALSYAASQLDDFSISEWVLDEKGVITYIDLKLAPSQFLLEEEKFIEGFKKNVFFTLNKPIVGKIVRKVEKPDAGVFFITTPLYNYSAVIQKYAKAVITLSGGVLSHLLVYASLQGIPCLVSRLHYDKFIGLNRLDLSSLEDVLKGGA